MKLMGVNWYYDDEYSTEVNLFQPELQLPLVT